MYPDKQFIVEDLDEIRAFVEKYPLATLVATKPSGEFAARGQDSAALERHLEELKNRFETSQDHKFASLPGGYIKELLPLIECFDIVVSDLRCIFKLSQNRKIEEFDRTVQNLRFQGGKSALVAEEMQLRRAKYCPS